MPRRMEENPKAGCQGQVRIDPARDGTLFRLHPIAPRPGAEQKLNTCRKEYIAELNDKHSQGSLAKCAE